MNPSRSTITWLLLLCMARADEFDAQQLPTCDLSCEHGGSCRLVSDQNDELADLVQSGKLIQTCQCLPGFGGMGCELDMPLESMECGLDGLCWNGRPCLHQEQPQLLEHNDYHYEPEYSCHCAFHDQISRFAGLMCRKPYTEYCSDQYSPEEEVSFCTNGGKCKSSLVSAQVAPFNTTANAQFRHLGCLCPAEFYGPHCEFLQHDLEPLQGAPEYTMNHQDDDGYYYDDDNAGDDGYWEEDSSEPDSNDLTTTASDAPPEHDSNNKWSSLLPWIILALSVVIVACGGWLVYRRRRRRRRRRKTLVEQKSQRRSEPSPYLMEESSKRLHHNPPPDPQSLRREQRDGHGERFDNRQLEGYADYNDNTSSAYKDNANDSVIYDRQDNNNTSRSTMPHADDSVIYDHDEVLNESEDEVIYDHDHYWTYDNDDQTTKTGKEPEGGHYFY